MSDVLFIGNGINRAFNGDSWEKLIDKIAVEFDSGLSKDALKDLPFPMQVVAVSKDNVNSAMKKISGDMNFVITEEQDTFLRKVLSVSVDNIITANYTFEIEQAIGIKQSLYSYRKVRKYTKNCKGKEDKFGLFKFYQPDNSEKKIWHIHGDITKPSTVIMGNYYYGKLLSEIQTYTSGFIKRYKTLKKQGLEITEQSWIDLFLTVPTNLFTWVGLDNFKLLTDLTASGAFAHAFPRVLGWTLVWAVTATLSCYIGGILMAMLINHRRTIAKPFWRTCFMIAMVVPQFVSLLLVRNLFADVGIVNTLCKQWGVTDWLYSIGAIPTANVIPFLTHPNWARPMILLINFWVGVPYQMLIATGILLNIPHELTEAARIDGANGWQVFRSITMPYLLHITGPSLVSGMVTNINNFNVIWLLSRDVYVTTDQLMAQAGATEVDLLVTWLYRLTQDQSNYKMASVIGILVFVVCSALTLVAFGRLTGRGREEAFH